MSSNDALFAEAEQLRINGNTDHDFHEAIKRLQAYLERGGSKAVEAHQMMGVCYQRLHQYDEAIECYLAAMEDASIYQLGNIERDMAENYGRLGRYDWAEICLANSLDFFPYDQYPVEHATSLGFLARLQQRQGQTRSAIATFADADEKLHVGNNRYTELYNKLAYASALSWAGRQFAARQIAFKSLKLSLTKDPETGHRYGSRKHHLRALVLFSGGHRLEDSLKERKST